MACVSSIIPSQGIQAVTSNPAGKSLQWPGTPWSQVRVPRKLGRPKCRHFLVELGVSKTAIAKDRSSQKRSAASSALSARSFSAVFYSSLVL